MSLLVLAAGALAGCGGDKQPGVATATSGAGPAASATAVSDAVARYVEAQRQWVRCLREEGFEVPDPDAKGQVDLRGLGGNRDLKQDPKWRVAQEECKEFNVEVPAELEPKEVLTAEQIAHRREYAKCMRAEGVPDFRDPAPDGSWPRPSDQMPTEQQAAAIFRASQVCEPVLDGRPPTTPNPNATGTGAG